MLFQHFPCNSKAIQVVDLIHSTALKSLCRKKSYCITTPIFYVNAPPHIGHLYTATLADAACRWQKLKHGQDAKLITGTDEHGLKVWTAAAQHDLKTNEYCNQVSKKYTDMCATFNIDYDDFVRTTEQRHKLAVEHFWKVLQDNGYIYKGEYEGWYSTADETFVPASEVAQVSERSHIHIESKNPVEWTTEINYKFRLSLFIERIRDWIERNPSVIEPAAARQLVLSILQTTNFDLSVSRESSRVPWGIRAPSDPTQTVYVWLDALVNYLTASGYPNTSSAQFKDMWPVDVHLVGIDIVKFHAVYWPAFLMAAGLDLPKKIQVHSHWTVDGVKMSKTKGNIIDPLKAANCFTAQGLRYFLLKQGVVETNCNFSELLAYHTINADLANDIGNCLSRATAKHLNPQQVYPAFHPDAFSRAATVEDEQFIELVRRLPYDVDQHAEEFHFYKALECIACVARDANQVIQRHQMWRFDQSVVDEKEFLDSLLYCIYEGLRVSGILLQVFVPPLACQLLDRIAVPQQQRRWKDAMNAFPSMDEPSEPQAGKRLVKTNIFFKRLKIPFLEQKARAS